MAFQPPTEIMSAKGSQKTGDFINKTCACLPLDPTLGAVEQKRAHHVPSVQDALPLCGLPLRLLFPVFLTLLDLQELMKCFKKSIC